MVDAAAGAARAPLPAPTPSPELVAAAEEFESMVLAQLLQPMFSALKTDGLGGGGFGEEIFRPLLVDEYAKGISAAGGVGLAQSIIAELTRLNTSPAEAADGADRR